VLYLGEARCVVTFDLGDARLQVREPVLVARQDLVRCERSHAGQGLEVVAERVGDPL